MSGELKSVCIRVLQELVGEFQTAKAAVTDEQLRRYMDPGVPMGYIAQFPPPVPAVSSTASSSKKIKKTKKPAADP